MSFTAAANASPCSLYCKYGKRCIDFVVSAALLVLCTPIILVTALLLKISGQGDVFFRQDRPGLHGEVFRIWKFKTMSDLYDHNGDLLPDDQRITRAGKIVRSLSLDELPQLLNVLSGDMSLIGPRPLLPRYLERYNSRQHRRHELRPGITGLAQVNGRNLLGWPERLELDVQYVETCSFLLDLKILLKTIQCLLTRRGISSSSSITMEEFKGNSADSI